MIRGYQGIIFSVPTSKQPHLQAPVVKVCMIVIEKGHINARTKERKLDDNKIIHCLSF